MAWGPDIFSPPTPSGGEDVGGAGGTPRAIPTHSLWRTIFCKMKAVRNYVWKNLTQSLDDNFLRDEGCQKLSGKI